jgi:hypothetical protein
MRQVNFFIEETVYTLTTHYMHHDSHTQLTDFDDTKPMAVYTLSTLMN